MSEFEKFKNRLFEQLGKGYRVIRTEQQDFGERLIGEWKRTFPRTDRIVLVYHFSKRKPSAIDFMRFTRDFQRFHEDYDRSHYIDGGYFVTYGEYDRQEFRYVLSKQYRKIKELIKIESLKEEKSSVKERRP